MLAVAFFTLLEQKYLGYINVRVGPNKVRVWGLFQSFRDALKLLSKDDYKRRELNYYFYTIAPLLGIFVGLIA